MGLLLGDCRKGPTSVFGVVNGAHGSVPYSNVL